MSTATKLGKVRCNPRGAYDPEAYYEILDIVSDSGSSYMAIEEQVPVGTPVSNTTYWLCIAHKGDTGATGAKGDKGDTGNGIASVSVEKTGTSGSVDTYTGTIEYTDETTATFTFTVTNGSVTSVNGMTGDVQIDKVALSDNFDSKMVLTDNSGYLYRTTGGSLEVGEQNRVKKIVGASVPIIQQLLNPNFDNADNWLGIQSVANHIATCRSILRQNTGIVDGHKYLGIARVKLTTAGTYLGFDLRDGVQVRTIANSKSTTDWQIITGIVSASGSYAGYIRIRDTRAEESQDDFQVNYVNIIDLTATFGTTVANRLYALQVAEFGSGVSKAKEILVKDYYPYNVTAFTHTKTSGKVNNGFNQWDEQWELGGLSTTTGATDSATNKIRSKNYIPVFPNTSYSTTIPSSIRQNNVNYCYYDANKKFISFVSSINNPKTTPSNAQYMKFFVDAQYGTTYKNDICINLHWDGERDGEYESYQEWNYPVQDIELKGILSLDAQDNWVADGDEYLPSGVVNENYFEQDLGDLDWTRAADAQGGYVFWASLPNGRQSTGAYGYSSCRCAKYIAHNTSAGTLDNLEMTQGSTYVSSSANIAIRDDAYSTASAFKTAVTGLILLFKGNTPTTSSADSYTELQNDSNWGTEKWIDTRDVPMPVFSTCEYIPDLKAKLETAPESPDEDGDYIMHRENGLNSYGSLSTWLSANGYNKLQDLSSAITDIAILNYVEKKLTRQGNITNLSIRASLTGTTSSSGTALFNIGSGNANVNGAFRFVGVVSNDIVQFSVEGNGDVMVYREGTNGTIYINISYSRT